MLMQFSYYQITTLEVYENIMQYIFMFMYSTLCKRLQIDLSFAFPLPVFKWKKIQCKAKDKYKK